MTGGPWEIGEDGFPVSPDHPANRDKRTASQLREHIFQRDAKAIQAKWNDDAELALRDILKLCHQHQQPLPSWAVAALDKILFGGASANRKVGRLGNSQAADRQNRVHYQRWATVKELRDRKEEFAHQLKLRPTWEEAFANASEALEGTAYAGSPEVMKKSYQLVERLFRSGKGARFFQPFS